MGEMRFKPNSEITIFEVITSENISYNPGSEAIIVPASVSKKTSSHLQVIRSEFHC